MKIITTTIRPAAYATPQIVTAIEAIAAKEKVSPAAVYGRAAIAGFPVMNAGLNRESENMTKDGGTFSVVNDNRMLLGHELWPYAFDTLWHEMLSARLPANSELVMCRPRIDVEGPELETSVDALSALCRDPAVGASSHKASIWAVLIHLGLRSLEAK